MDWTKWDWQAMINRYCGDIAPIVATMIAMAGIVGGKIVETLPRHVHLAILNLLRPAEAIVRRIIVMAAHGLEVAPPVRAGPVGPIPRGKGQNDRIPAFPLFDPRKAVGPRRKTAPGYGPRVWVIGGENDPAFQKPAPKPDDPVSAARLCRRVLSLKAALENIPRQARRLVRALARTSCKWQKPMRPGRPPGHKARGKDAIDEILASSQEMALIAILHPKPG